MYSSLVTALNAVLSVFMKQHSFDMARRVIFALVLGKLSADEAAKPVSYSGQINSGYILYAQLMGPGTSKAPEERRTNNGDEGIVMLDLVLKYEGCGGWFSSGHVELSLFDERL